MRILGLLLFGGAILFVDVFWLLWFRDMGYRKGYEDGREDAENWGKEIDLAADEARKQIWREEARKGMWL